MKIASEIVEAVRALQPQLEYNVAWNDMASVIVAEKLLPIRDSLKMMWNNPKEMTATDIMTQYLAACEMLDDECNHEWVDATNEFVSSGEVCVKCHAIRATPEEE